MKISDILTEMTSAGAIATVAKPMGSMIKRPGPAVKKKKKKTTEDSPNRLRKNHNTDGKTYRGKPMPYLDGDDVVDKAQEIGSFDDDEFAYDQETDREIDTTARDKKLAALLKTLNQQEQEVMRMRYEDDMNYTEVAKVLNLSKQRIRQIEMKALRKMRHPSRSDSLAPYVERKLSKAEIKKRDDYADDLPDAEFKKRYGKDWEAVKYGTATNMAKRK